jgi:hypothetical protein
MPRTCARSTAASTNSGSQRRGSGSSAGGPPSFRRCCARSTIRRRASSSAAPQTWSCCPVRRSPSSARAPAPATALRSRGASRGISPPPGSSASSGLARGSDAEAHRGVLEAGGTTVAVLGCGIDRDYPAAHHELSRRIAETGLIVSEYAPGVEPAPWRFPARKRRPPAAMPFWLNHADVPAVDVAKCSPRVVSVWSRENRLTQATLWLTPVLLPSLEQMA